MSWKHDLEIADMCWGKVRLLSKMTPSSRSAKVSHHAATTRSERSGAADSRFTDERTRDTSSEAAPLATRWPSSGLQTLHHDALNAHRSVSDVSCWHGVCRRRQPDEVRSAIRRHRSIHKTALSHWDRQARVLIRRPSCLERSPIVTSLHHGLETF